MSAEDDTFDIDIYGDDTEPVEAPQADHEFESLYDDDEIGKDHAYDTTYQEDAKNGEEDRPVKQEQSEADDSHVDTSVEQPPETTAPNGSETTPAPPQQGTKRKAPSDSEEIDYNITTPNVSDSAAMRSTPDTRPLDPGALPALKLADLNWWTTEEDLRAYCSRAGVEDELRELKFGEHTINGKSRGEAYLEFTSPQASTAVRREMGKQKAESAEAGGSKKVSFSVHFTSIGNPFKTGPPVAGANKEFNNSRGRGAYNQNYRGNFRGRGGGGGFNNDRGGFNQNQHQNHNQNQNQNQGIFNQSQQGGGWNMAGGGGFAGNPMMGAYGGNPMMGQFGNMGRGGMMNMMGRGGYGGNMGMAGGMGMNRGGMMGMQNMMGRGGWGGGSGFQGGMQQPFNNFQAGGGGGMQQQQQQQGNKRPKME